MTAEDDRVRSYIIAQANKLSLPELVEKVRKDSAPLEQVAATVPADHFFDRPAKDDWSAAEVFTHILEMNESGATAIPAIIDSGVRPERVRDQVSGSTREGLKTAADYWAAFIGPREQLLAKVLTAKGDEHLDVKITHPQFGAMSWREWLLFMRVHDLDHMRQLQTLASHFAPTA